MNTNYREIYDLLDKLCIKLAGKKHKDVIKRVTQYISNSPVALSTNLLYNETSIVAKITNHLSSKSHNDSLLFINLHEQLTTYTELKNRNAILTFLLLMADSEQTTQTSFNGGAFDAATFYSGSSYLDSTATLTNAKSTQLEKIYPHLDVQPNIVSASSSSSSSAATIKTAESLNNKLTRYEALNKKQLVLSNNKNNLNLYDTQEELVQDAIYSFTGIQGKYLRKTVNKTFKLDPKIKVLNKCHSSMLLRLAELGYYHDQVDQYTDPKSGRCPLGLLGQGLISALNNELTQYYGMVAMLQEQLNRQRNIQEYDMNPGEKLTLLKLGLWSTEPMHRLQWLSTITEACQDKKGGALASAVYDFQTNGDPSVKLLARELLVAVCNPLQYMLSRWLLDGEIVDPYSEFFIEIIPDVGTDRLWYDKYRLRELLLPNFISRKVAHKILVTGKSINFLKKVCQDTTSIKGRDELIQCFDNNADSIFATGIDMKFNMVIDNAYLNTSKKVLDIVMEHYKLLEHLYAMRRYLLLGQGDFFGLLMEQLKPKLDRPGKDLYLHDLSAIMDSAIRATNGQLDDPEILNHLDVILMDAFDGDTGWDIFLLQYTVQGPLSTILKPSMCNYRILFKPLWETKRIEFILSSKIWKEQMCNAKYLRLLQKDINNITYHLHLFTSEMIHFISQMHYYIFFEVVECSWANLLKKIQQAKAIDDILDAHNEFLKAIRVGTFLDNKSSLSGILKSIYNIIMKLELWQTKFYTICDKELEERKLFEKNIAVTDKSGKFGVTTKQHLERDENEKIFLNNIKNCEIKLETLSSDYEAMVKQFLLQLSSTNEHSLQLFAIRLDFNEYYKKNDQRLGMTLTFEHMRMSAITSAHDTSKHSFLSKNSFKDLN